MNNSIFWHHFLVLGAAFTTFFFFDQNGESFFYKATQCWSGDDLSAWSFFLYGGLSYKYLSTLQYMNRTHKVPMKNSVNTILWHTSLIRSFWASVMENIWSVTWCMSGNKHVKPQITKNVSQYVTFSGKSSLIYCIKEK